MAKELQVRSTPGTTVYALLLNSVGQVWNTGTLAFETLDAAHRANYALALTASALTDLFFGDMPTVPAGAYSYLAYLRLGGSPAQTDIFLGSETLQWDGAAVIAFAGLVISVQAVASAAGLSAGTLTVLRGDTLSVSLTGLGSLAGRTKLWFTAKRQPSLELDSASVVQITETGGLLYLNGAAASAGGGSLVVTDAALGAVTVGLTAGTTALLGVGRSHYDLQMLTAAGVVTLATGRFVVEPDVTRVVA